MTAPWLGSEMKPCELDTYIRGLRGANPSIKALLCFGLINPKAAFYRHRKGFVPVLEGDSESTVLGDMTWKAILRYYQNEHSQYLAKREIALITATPYRDS